MSMNGTLPTPEDIKRVKGLGFLHDKTTADCFNARVITRNGTTSSRTESPRDRRRGRAASAAARSP